jgi:hypothetical protein
VPGHFAQKLRKQPKEADEASPCVINCDVASRNGAEPERISGKKRPVPDETITIPLNDPDAHISVRVVALHKGKGAGPFDYFQSMRSGLLKRLSADPEDTETARAYHRNKERYFAMLANAVPTDADAVISPPSRMPWQAEPYRQAILSKNPKAADLTPQVTRTGKTFAGEGATIEAVAAGLNYAPTGQEHTIRRLVIVDDTLTTGTTAAAIVEVLRTHGLPAECEIVIACPLWLDTVAIR